MDKKQNIITILVSLLMVALLLPIGLNLFANRRVEISTTPVHPNIYQMEMKELLLIENETEYEFDLPLTIVAFSASASGYITIGERTYYTNGTWRFTRIDPITGPFTVKVENDTESHVCTVQLIATLGNGPLFNLTTEFETGALFFDVNQTQLNITLYDVNSVFGSSFLILADRVNTEGMSIQFENEYTVYPFDRSDEMNRDFFSGYCFAIAIGHPVNGTIRIEAYSQTVHSAIPENLQPIWNMIPIFIVIGILMYFVPEIKKRWR